ncbi:6,7-dimethyl-8-ribityllumazine synthase [Flavicella sp.]|jgi:6,7-dimethyl-8-ribityllumazine synthase|nr:6,7-dimethyl-8-ribityllumazine synthase [Flavicella sp.]MDA9111814.1 6,7-dimethyl-8-ribityllumazine synthase [Flavicella sp.]|tara:strand:- start:19878 stop:20357 length:480 start_codon:yes stop_codon:yes gene_type:complete
MATTNLSAYDKTSLPSAKNFRFGMVVSEWNEEITNALYEGALEALTANGALPENIIKWEVPGSFELIYGSKKMVQTQNLDAVIAIGNVIKGETKHFDFVCDGVTQGIKDLNIQQETPIIFCVLTDDTREQSIARSGGVHGNKGIECAVAAIKMAVLKQL